MNHIYSILWEQHERNMIQNLRLKVWMKNSMLKNCEIFTNFKDDLHTKLQYEKLEKNEMFVFGCN